VLVVDDEESVRSMLEMVFSLEDMDVTLAHDGDDAIMLAQIDPPDVVVLDIMMPRVDGWTVAGQLRTDPRLRNIPIVICSALNGDEHVLRGWEHGAAAFIAKPFNTEELVQAVRAAVDDPPLLAN
jgi:CheY-like chemotaxis protein